MAKPLISDAQMLAIHETMLRLQEARPPTDRHRPARAHVPLSPAIPLLAATMLQLRTQDVLITQGHQPLAEQVIALAHEASFHPEQRPALLRSGDPRNVAALAAGHAFAQARSTRPADDAPITVALVETNAALCEAVRLAGESMLPLLLIVQEPDSLSFRELPTAPNVETILIDANDALACCRVMQESVLRTRNRWGSVVLQAVTLPNSPDPLLTFRSHLVRRGLSNRL